MLKIFFYTVVVYYSIATFILVNLIYNPAVKLELVHKKTKEIKSPSDFYKIVFSLWWIVFLPISILNTRRRKNE